MIKKFGIIGNPIKHSLSPVLHNYWFQKYKIDANYSTIEIYNNELSEIVKKIKQEPAMNYEKNAISHWIILSF